MLSRPFCVHGHADGSGGSATCPQCGEALLARCCNGHNVALDARFHRSCGVRLGDLAQNHVTAAASESAQHHRGAAAFKVNATVASLSMTHAWQNQAAQGAARGLEDFLLPGKY